MAETAQVTQKLKSALKVLQYDFDPNATSATEIAWQDMRDYSSLLVGFFRTVGTSDLTFEIVANTASDGGGTDVVVKTVSPAAEPDAVGDHVWYEIDTEDILEAAGDADYRYVTARLTVATGTDEGVVTYILDGRHKQENLTADVLA